jgi:hypothetical protein
MENTDKSRKTPPPKPDLRFDWYPRYDHKTLNQLAETIVDEVERIDQKSDRGAAESTRRTKRLLIARHLISALYTAHTNSGCVSMPLRASSYASKGDKPGRVHYSYDYTKAVYDQLRRNGFIEVVTEPHDKQHTRIAAGGSLRTAFDTLGFIWMKQDVMPDTKSVQLRDVERDEDGRPKRSGRNRDTKKFDLHVPNTAEVQKYRDNLRFINGELSKHCIHLDLSDEHMKQLKAEMTASDGAATATSEDTPPIQNVQLRRIFARGSMQKGGRFYGAWWQQIPERHRPHIRIDGYRTVEVDYSGIAIRIISALSGAPLPRNVDPYDIGLPGWTGSDDPRRKTVKKTVNALINDEDGEFRIGDEVEAELGIDEQSFRHLLKKTHPKVYERLADGIGLEAQYIDSQIAEAVILEMLKEGIVVLPIHDSFRVRAGYQQWVTKVMEAAFCDLTGAEISVEADIIKDDHHFGLTPPEHDDRTEDEKMTEAAVDTETLRSRLLVKKISRMETYYRHWARWRVHNDCLFSSSP